MKPKRHNGGIIRQVGKKFQAEVNNNYKRHRKTFPREAQARAWIDLRQIEIHNRKAPLTIPEMDLAREAMAMLPEGVTLTQAARFYLDHHPSQSSVTVAAAVEEFLEAKGKGGLRPHTLSGYRQHLNRWAEAMGEQPLAAVRPAALSEWLDGLGLQGVSRNNLRRSLSVFYGWAIRQGYAMRNPADGVETVAVDENPPPIFPPETVRRLMAATATEPVILPFYALGFFAGLRPEEIQRLRWEDVGDTHIRIGPEVAKVRRQRFVAIEPNLARWLSLCRKASGPVVERAVKARRERERAVRKAAKVTRWPVDVARHSFGSYHYARGMDAGKTAHEMGHSSPSMLFRHYRNLASPGDAKRFFGIVPCPEEGAKFVLDLSSPVSSPAKSAAP